MYLTSELNFNNADNTIKGEIYLPSIMNDKKIPMVVLLNDSSDRLLNVKSFADKVANTGYSVYTYNSKESEIANDATKNEELDVNKYLEFSIVLEGVLRLPFIDENSIFVALYAENEIKVYKYEENGKLCHNFATSLPFL